MSDSRADALEEDLLQRMTNILLISATFSELSWATNEDLARHAAETLLQMVKATSSSEAALIAPGNR